MACLKTKPSQISLLKFQESGSDKLFSTATKLLHKYFYWLASKTFIFPLMTMDCKKPKDLHQVTEIMKQFVSND